MLMLTDQNLLIQESTQSCSARRVLTATPSSRGTRSSVSWRWTSCDRCRRVTEGGTPKWQRYLSLPFGEKQSPASNEQWAVLLKSFTNEEVHGGFRSYSSLFVLVLIDGAVVFFPAVEKERGSPILLLLLLCNLRFEQYLHYIELFFAPTQ